MKSRLQIKCLCCKELHAVDRRNAGRQNYCNKPACRKASKAASQRKWCAKEENKDYFRCEENSARVRTWRVANPGYWRRKARGEPVEEVALQETLVAQTVDIQLVEPTLAQDTGNALQDICPAQNPLLVGLVATFFGFALQDDIAGCFRQLLIRGEDILRMSPGGLHLQCHETQSHTVPRTPAARAAPV
jgi:hypothetical protein